METIRMKVQTETIVKKDKKHRRQMHYFYLCSGGEEYFLCKQRRYQGVEQHFRRDLRLEDVYRHKWGRDRMLDNLMEKLPSRLEEARRCADDWAA